MMIQEEFEKETGQKVKGINDYDGIRIESDNPNYINWLEARLEKAEREIEAGQYRAETAEYDYLKQQNATLTKELEGIKKGIIDITKKEQWENHDPYANRNYFAPDMAKDLQKLLDLFKPKETECPKEGCKNYTPAATTDYKWNCPTDCCRQTHDLFIPKEE